jgi:hypothetical protein
MKRKNYSKEIAFARANAILEVAAIIAARGEKANAIEVEGTFDSHYKIYHSGEPIRYYDPSIEEWRYTRQPNCSVSNHVANIQLYVNGYAEPGYNDPACGIIALGNWNAVAGEWDPVKGTRPSLANGDLPQRIERLFEKLGIECEWADEWVSCTDCDKLIRTQPDCHWWTPSYHYNESESEVLCDKCHTLTIEEEEEEDKYEDSEDSEY